MMLNNVRVLGGWKMKKFVVLMMLVALLLTTVFVGTAFAHEGEPHCHWASGFEFGQHHAEMARLGMLGKDMNPGTHHRGYSICVP
jgi:hypothetical protein